MSSTTGTTNVLDWRQVNRVALHVITDVEKISRASLRDTLTLYFGEYEADSRTRSATSAVAYGVFRNFGQLDWIVEQSTGFCVKDMEGRLRNILRIGTFQYLFFTNVKLDDILSACIFQFVDSFKERDFITSSLQNIAQKISNKDIQYPSREEKPIEFLMVRKSFPRWMVEKFVDWYGYEEAEKLCDALKDEEVKINIRANFLKVEDVATLRQKLQEEGVQVSKPKYCPDEALILDRLPPDKLGVSYLEAYKRGLFYVQNESTMFVSILLGPKPGETIIDLCSAPGGKTTHIASLMRNQGRIFAVDIDGGRLAKVEQHCKRLGIQIVKTCEGDGRCLSLKSLGLETQVDRVLVDAPCSMLGISGRRPELRLKIGPADAIGFQESQSCLLHNASNLVRPGGSVVYSTCTLGYEENDYVVNNFLESHPEFEKANLLAPRIKGVPLEVIGEFGFVRVLPHKQTELDGGFAALLRKKTV
jgi:16S rRNA (cytosine967-C5)-methyltransferase